jgi:hypothetical protein
MKESFREYILNYGQKEYDYSKLSTFLDINFYC